jgi:3-oxoacyl-(acyl-carrier-protein) synthase
MMPNGVTITGIGIVCSKGTDAASVWKRMNETPAVNAKKTEGELDFTVNLPASKLRRVNRYSKLALAGVMEAQKDAGITLDEASAFRYGLILTTGYGSIVSNVRFAESVAKGDPDSCSPTLFSGTVANSGVGQVCTQLRLKGPGTVLIGGNVFVYSKLLLDTGRADILFAGAVEEYSPDLWDSLGKNEVAPGLNINEATAVMAFERAPALPSRAYCALGNGISAGLEGFPQVKKIDLKSSTRTMKRALEQCSEKNRDAGDVDIVFSSASGSYFDEAEAQAIEEAFPHSFVVSGVKDFFGETLGCAFCLNVAVAAMCLKNGSIPPSLTRSTLCDAGFRNILVTGFDPAGNYNCIVLRECE